MGQRRESLDVQLAALRGAFVLAFPAVLVFVFAATILVARRSTRAIDRLAETVESITAKGLDQRLATADTDMEFRRLVDGFNAMLERLEVSFKNSQRFTGNAAHELKTPLTILRGQLEGAIGREDAGSERQRALAEMLEETARLKTIIDRLLLLARADAGRLDLFPIEFNLSTTIEGLIEDAAAMTEGLDFQADFKPKVLITADRALVSQVLHNLISNAVKYNRGSGYVRVKMRERGEGIHIMVANSGEAIDAERREQIFERFYRGDAAHNRDVDGVGLGLNLAREIARAHGGDLVLAASGEPGNAFILSLPKRAKNRQKSAE